MARLFCHVHFKPGRITFAWSEGKTPFEPYHLDGDESRRLDELSRSARQRLAQEIHGNGDATDLVALGKQLYRAIFRLDSTDAAAKAVHDWCQKRSEGDTIDFVSNSPGRIPWNLVWHGKEGSNDPSGFWGMRYAMGGGRAVSPLLSMTNLPPATGLFLLPDGGPDFKPLADWVRERQIPTLSSASDVLESLSERAADIVFLSGPYDRGQVRLKDAPLALDEVFESIRATAQGNPYPLLVLGLEGPASEVEHWECLAGSVGSNAAGAVLPEVPLPRKQITSFSQSWLAPFITGKVELGDALRRARQEIGLEGLAWSAQAPAGLCIDRADGGEGYPEPQLRPFVEQPYSPFAALEREQRMFLAGRQAQVVQCAQVLTEARGLMLHGGMCTGKTSFVHAGLLPYLEEESIGYLALRDRSGDAVAAGEDGPVLTLRPGPDILGQLCQGLAHFAARPLDFTDPTGKTVRLDLPQYFAAIKTSGDGSTAVQAIAPTAVQAGASSAAGDTDSGPTDWAQKLYHLAPVDGEGFLRIVDELTKRLPWELVVVFEQTEDVAAATADKDRRLQRLGLDLLTRIAAGPARCKVILSVRSDSLGPTLALLPGGKDRGAWREFYLPPLTEEDMKDIVLLPTATEPLPYSDGTPHAAYQYFVEDEALARSMVTEVMKTARDKQMPPLPLLHVVADEMYRHMKSRNDNTLRSAALRGLDPIADLPVKTVARVLTKNGLSRRDVYNLLEGLAVIEPDGSCRRVLSRLDTLLPSSPTGREGLEQTVDRLAQTEPPLVEVHNLLVKGQPELFISLANDGLAATRKRERALKELSSYGWTKIIDTLWIMIPMAALAAALAFFFTNRYNVAKMAKREEELAEKAEKDVDKVLEHYKTQFAAAKTYVETELRWPTYQEKLAAARTALERHDLVDARASLFTALASAQKSGKDLRRFEWFHLYRQLHPERYALLGHPGPIVGVAISPDGKLLASASVDGTIKLWNAEKLSELQTVPSEKVAVHAIAFTDDGKSLAAARADKTVQVWELTEGKGAVQLSRKPRELKGHDGEVVALASAPGQALASLDQSGKIIVWDLKKGEAGTTVSAKAGSRGLVHGLGGLVTLEDGKAVIYDAASGKVQASRDVALAGADALAWDEDSKTLAVGGAGKDGAGEVVLLKADGKAVASPRFRDRVRALAWAKGQKKLLVGTRDHAVHVWDQAAEKLSHTWRSHLGWINSLAAGGGGLVLSGAQDAQVKVWSLSDTFEPDMIRAQDGPIAQLLFAVDGKVLVSGDAKGAVQFWEPGTGKLLTKIEKSGHRISALALNTDKESGKLAYSWSDDKGAGGTALADLNWDEKKGLEVKQHAPLAGQSKGATALALARDGKTLFLAPHGGAPTRWDMVKGAVDKDFEDAKAEVVALALAGTEQLLVAGTSAGDVVVFDAFSGKKKGSEPGHVGGVRGLIELASRGTDSLFYSWGKEDGLVKMWSWEKVLEEELSERRGSGPVEMARSPKGIPLMVFSRHDNPAVLQVVSREEGRYRDRGSLTGGPGVIRALAVSPDETLIVAGSDDGTIRFWRAATAEQTVNPKPR